MGERDTGEPLPSKQCKCSAVIIGLSEYHLKKHLKGQKHKSGVIQSKLISTYFSAAGPSSARAPVSRRNKSELEVSYVVHRHNNLPVAFFCSFSSSIVMHASVISCYSRDRSHPAQFEILIHPASLLVRYLYTWQCNYPLLPLQ